MTSDLYIPGQAPAHYRPVYEVLRDAGLTDGQKVRINNWLLPEEKELLEAIRNSKFFLVRNDGSATGERYKFAPKKAAEQALKLARQSGDREAIAAAFYAVQDAPEGCGREHAYFTLMCIDQPFRGLNKALYALAAVREDNEMVRNILEWAPDIADGHPETARAWKPELPGQDLLGIALGFAEPITKARAEMLASLIQSKRPPRPFIL